jgi:hypothetical protein
MWDMRHRYLIAAAVASALAGAFAAKLHTRWATTCANVPCGYLQLRLAAIDQMIAARSTAPTYLVIGDSLTEIGRWPTMCGHDPVAAGISGARSDTWLPRAKAIADTVKPAFVVLALGTNDVLSQGRLGPYEELAASLSGYRLVAVPVHQMPAAPPAEGQQAHCENGGTHCRGHCRCDDRWRAPDGRGLCALVWCDREDGVRQQVAG